jgi:hypothetical protein
MVDKVSKPKIKRIDWADQVAKGNYTVKLCYPVEEVIRRDICPPDFEEDYKICRPFVDKIVNQICVPTIVMDKIPGICGIQCRIDCSVLDISSIFDNIIQEEMKKYYAKNMAQYAEIKKNIDLKANAIIKEVRSH